jgi:predicted Zn-dependent protease
MTQAMIDTAEQQLLKSGWHPLDVWNLKLVAQRIAFSQDIFQEKAILLTVLSSPNIVSNGGKDGHIQNAIALWNRLSGDESKYGYSKRCLYEPVGYFIWVRDVSQIILDYSNKLLT